MRISDWSSDVCSSDLLFDEQLVYIVNHAGDRMLCFDAAFLPIVERLKEQLPTVEHFVLFDAPAQEGYLSYRELIAAADGRFDWVAQGERDPVDRQRVGSGPSVSDCVDLGGRGTFKKKKY